MQFQEALRNLSSTLSVQARPPDDPQDQGIWIRIPTAILGLREVDSPAPYQPSTSLEMPLRTGGVEGSAALAVPMPQPAHATAVFRSVGHLREIGFAGRLVTLREMQGFRIYAQVLARPQARLTAIELRAGLAMVDRSVCSGTFGAMASGEAISELRRSYESLSEELEEAELAHDAVRQERLEREITALGQHLAKVIGRGGKGREAGDGERARVAVCKAMRRARDVLKTHHPELCRHLERSVSAGTSVIYRPEAPVTWDL
ncbi:hypothetical protein LBMAG53_23180 [Planctomycetota bacterium]|nr:hypothetical protein LBMAG53_23180 [Planctomycetota bacterium]